MTELVLRNIDKAVLDKLNLSGEAREVFRKLLAGRVLEDKRPQGLQDRKRGGDGLRGDEDP